MRTQALVPFVLLALMPPAILLAQDAVDDPYMWLEDVEGERALSWATERSDATLLEFQNMPVFDSIMGETLTILGSPDRIAMPSMRGDLLYNYWRDNDHPRGYYRRTTWDSYLSGDPDWETVLDVDALVAEEGVPWAYRGMDCLGPAHRLCLVSLSRGGADATEIREFDLERLEFVEDGFFLPEAKNGATFIDENTVLVSTDFGGGTMTSSGYPRLARLWTRGQPLSRAETIFEADVTDMAVFTGTFEMDGEDRGVVMHLTTIFEREMHLLLDGELVRVDTPADAQAFVAGDQLVVRTVSAWTVGEITYAPATVIAMDVHRFLAGERDFRVVAESTGDRIVQGAAPTKDYLLVNVLDNVQGELWRYRFDGSEWIGERLPVPGMGTVRVASADVDTNRFFFSYSALTQPNTLYLGEEDGSIGEVRRTPDMFRTAGLTVEQHRATSKDGTEVPFFIVHREGLEHDGTNPTLLNAYGGFQVSRTATYNAILGNAWMARGGVYVLANIRGGGEFGPSWWEAALKENRQRAYDDFLAVAEWLVEHGVASPDHLGIMGGSNGGLLVGVAMTQRPDLFDAVVVQVPLLDMKRYHKLLAGASWMAEYGNPDVPEEWAYIGKYSPYQNVRENVEYPRALFTTTTRDDRVHPGHARKMAAKMTDMGHRVFYFENTEGGHGSGVTPEQQARMWALTYSYLWRMLGARDRPSADDG
jgi:prolyl oligopeptidase